MKIVYTTVMKDKGFGPFDPVGLVLRSKNTGNEIMFPLDVDEATAMANVKDGYVDKVRVVAVTVDD
jgi:hypothetical protein